MRYEDSLEFGRNASVINEAYAKMYSTKKTQSVNESASKKISSTTKHVNEAEEDFDDKDFIFTHSKYADSLKRRYPEWLIAAAKKAGHELPLIGDEPTSYHGRGRKDHGFEKIEPQKKTEEVDDGVENLWYNVIMAHPDVFNDEHYDMEALKNHKKEFFEKWSNHILSGCNEIEAAKRSWEEIPGCQSKEVEQQSDEFIGNIDGDEVAVDDETEVEKSAADIRGNSGFGVVVRSYDDVSIYKRTRRRVSYVTPQQFKGAVFATKDEAIEELRNYLVEQIDEENPRNVLIGAVVDHDLTNKLIAGKFANEKDKPNSTVYTISTSDKKNTDTAIALATGLRGSKIPSCDEYLQ